MDGNVVPLSVSSSVSKRLSVCLRRILRGLFVFSMLNILERNFKKRHISLKCLPPS